MARVLERKQQNLLNEAARDMASCACCNKKNRPLFACSYDNCDQNNRMLCSRCGVFTHDDDCDHSFDVTQPYIHALTITFALDHTSKQKIKKGSRTLEMVESYMDEQRESGPRNMFFNALYNGGNAICQLDAKTVGKWVRNDAFFKKSFSTMSTAIRNGSLKECAQEMKTVLFDIGDCSFEATKLCKEGAIVAAGLMLAAEFCYLTIQFGRGKFTLKQYAQKTMVAIGTSFGAAVGNIGGSAVGAAIGTYVCPVIGTAVGGIIGGLLGALFVGAAAKKSIEDMSWFNDKNDEAIREQMIKEALIAFGYTYDDIKNPDVFNEEKIGKTYRALAKMRHPDRGGTTVQFQKLNGDMALLLSLLEKPKHVQKELAKKIQAISL